MRIERPYRVRHHHRQRVAAPAAEIFALLCPVREAEWIEGWSPRVVYTECGLAESECVFLMPNEPHDDIWVVTEHDPVRHRIGFVKVTPGELVTRVQMSVRPDGDGCTAEIDYSFTAIGEAGRARVDALTPEAWAAFMELEWERSLNAWLARRAASGGTSDPS